MCCFLIGKSELCPGEDPHVIADCVKVSQLVPINLCISLFNFNCFTMAWLWIMQYVLRELPSSPVPASCCNALLEACRKFLLRTWWFFVVFIISTLHTTEYLPHEKEMKSLLRWFYWIMFYWPMDCLKPHPS